MRIHICKFSHNIDKCTHSHTQHRNTNTQAKQHIHWAELAKYLYAALLVLPTKTIFAMQMMTGSGRQRESLEGEGGSVEEAGEASTVLCGIATMRKHGTNTSGRCGAMCEHGKHFSQKLATICSALALYKSHRQCHSLCL